MLRSMMQAYVKNSAEALLFYQDAFGTKLNCRHENDDGTIAHAELDLFGQVFAISEVNQTTDLIGNSMQFCLHFGEGKETLVQNIIDKLSKDGEIVFLGSTDWSPLMADLIDKFGVRWCIFV